MSGLFAGGVPKRALAKTDPPAGLREDAAGCEEAGCAAFVLAGVVPERAVPKSDPPAGLEEDATVGCKEAGCAADVNPSTLKVRGLLADVMVGTSFAENSPPVAGSEESAADLEGSPNKDDSRTLL